MSGMACEHCSEMGLTTPDSIKPLDYRRTQAPEHVMHVFRAERSKCGVAF